MTVTEKELILLGAPGASSFRLLYMIYTDTNGYKVHHTSRTYV